jgi:hypothetical protein
VEEEWASEAGRARVWVNASASCEGHQTPPGRHRRRTAATQRRAPERGRGAGARHAGESERAGEQARPARLAGPERRRATR